MFSKHGIFRSPAPTTATTIHQKFSSQNSDNCSKIQIKNKILSEEFQHTHLRSNMFFSAVTAEGELVGLVKLPRKHKGSWDHELHICWFVFHQHAVGTYHITLYWKGVLKCHYWSHQCQLVSGSAQPSRQCTEGRLRFSGRHYSFPHISALLHVWIQGANWMSEDLTNLVQRTHGVPLMLNGNSDVYNTIRGHW